MDDPIRPRTIEEALGAAPPEPDDARAPLHVLLAEAGYVYLREVDGQRLGVLPQICNAALCYGLDESGAVGQFHYASLLEAVLALARVTRPLGEHSHPSGPWIVHKGAHGEQRPPRPPAL